MTSNYRNTRGRPERSYQTCRVLIRIVEIEVNRILDLAVQEFVRGAVGCANRPDGCQRTEVLPGKAYRGVCRLVGGDSCVILSQFAPLP
jgi:hypothetical protein